MSIDKPLEYSPGEKPADVTIGVVNPEAVTIETEDGGAIVIFNPEFEDEGEPEFGSNLADYIDDSELGRISQELVSHFDNDIRSRADWEKTYKSGLDLLGLKIEDRSTPWAGACGVFHPILSEAAVRFQSQSIMETFPAGGPVRTKFAGKITPEKEKQALRVKDDLNYFLTSRMSEYRSEHERMLFSLPLAGAAFKKVYFDPSFGRPVAMFVPAEDFVAPYGASDLVSCPRYTHIMYKYPNELKKLQVSGFYRDMDLPEPVTQVSQIQQSKNELTGETEANADDRHQLLEIHVELDIEGYEDKGEDDEPTGIALPYVVTIDRQSGLILSIYRNWRQDDPLKLKRMHFVQYGYVPGFGFYAFGLIHLIGGIAKSATSILRQLVDAGTLANLPAGLKARGLRIKGDSTPLMPGEFRDVDVPSGAIKDAITFLPYKEPSQVLAALLGTMVEEGRRFASIADLQIGDSNQQAPVGTTLALMERAMKVMSAVQARLHASLAQELDILVEIIKTHSPDEYEYETDPGATRSKDYDDRIDVIPVTDPNAASLSQRVVQYQAALQLASQAPNMYDLPELHRQMLAVLGINDIEKIIPSTKDKRPADPISENMDILNGKPVKAFIYQDHEAHIQTHMSAMQNPKIMALIGQNPMAGGIQAAMMAHINEHIAFQYRREIEEQLGVQLPEPNAELPEDVEVMLSKLVAEASGRLLAKDQAEAQQQQIQQQMQDPVVQAQMQDAQNKQMEVQRKIAKDKADDMAKAEQRQIERDRIDSQERIAGVNAGIKAASDRDKNNMTADKNRADAKLAGFKAGQEIARNLNGSV
tara:strand:+ start:2677 stop:5124 length:2448 start_codon:yes stop_codon:yes gene_type:complete